MCVLLFRYLRKRDLNSEYLNQKHDTFFQGGKVRGRDKKMVKEKEDRMPLLYI